MSPAAATPPPPAPTGRARTGKIARLPTDLRLQLNRRLRDNEPGVRLTTWLNSLPEVQHLLTTQFDGVEISSQNLSEWRAGGYREWAEEQEKAESLRDLAHLSYTLAAAAGPDLAAGPLAIATGKIMAALESAEGEDLLNLTHALTKLRTAELDAAKARLATAEAARKERETKLAEEKFQRETCDLFLTWRADDRAKSIADSTTLDRTAKLAALSKLMFGPRPTDLLGDALPSSPPAP